LLFKVFLTIYIKTIIEAFHQKEGFRKYKSLF